MNGDSGMTMRPIIDKPDEETLEKIDFVIQGVENGLFKDLSKKIDFHQKLKGEDSKHLLASMIAVIEAQASELENMQERLQREQNTRMSMETQISELEEKVSNYKQDMRGIANALIAIANPDPLGQGSTYVDDVAAEQFVTKYKQAY